MFYYSYLPPSVLGLSLSVASSMAPLDLPTMPTDMKAVIGRLKSFQGAPIPQLTYDQAREQAGPADAVMVLLARQGNPSTDPDVVMHQTAMPGPSGKPLVLKHFRPARAAGTRLPTIVYFHGGGWVIAGTRGYQASCEALAKMANANVIEVAYRMAPESKFPAAHEDCYAALQYVAKNPSKFMSIAGKVSVLGESAGGNLAAAVCMMAKDRRGFMPKAQILVYPVTQQGMVTPSYRANEKSVPLSTPMLPWFYRYYFGSPKGTTNPYGAPLRAPLSKLRGLPKATFILAEIDPLLSEGKLYAAKLRKAGVSVQTHLYPGMTHEFFGMGAVVSAAKQAEKVAANALRKSWGM